MNTTPLPDHVGTKGKIVVPPNKTVLNFTIKDEIVRRQSGKPDKCLCLQKIEFEDKREEIRLGYYILDKKSRMPGKWVWGRFAALMPTDDFRALFREAEKKPGWI
jgi:hypothetical protein